MSRAENNAKETDARQDFEARVAVRTAEIQGAYDRERRIARKLQEALLSSLACGDVSGVCVETVCEVAFKDALVGGDFADAFPLPPDETGEGMVALVLGDVCGKGLLAAIRIPAAKYVLRAFLHENPCPGLALTRLNRFLCAEMPEDEVRFTALSLAVVGVESGRMRCTVAGAEPPLILRADGQAESVPGGWPAAGIDATLRYAAEERRLMPGDLLLLVTDGMTEARQGPKFLGYAGLVEIARTQAGKRPAMPRPGDQPTQAARLRQFGRAILEDAIAFAGGALHDDACLLLLEKQD